MKPNATEKEFRIKLQMSLDQIPAQRSKQATKRTAKAANTNKYI